MPSTRKPINHGSPHGWQAHRRRNEPVCGACAEARAAYMAEFRANRADIRSKDRRNSRIRTEALRLLVENHRDEFNRLLVDVRREMP